MGISGASIWASAKVAGVYGGPKGFLVGTGIGVIGELAKPLYREYIKPMIKSIQREYNIAVSNFENQLISNWFDYQ